jgi:hypothetical protein
MSEMMANEPEGMRPLMPVRVDGHGALTWEGDFALGARVDIPIRRGGLAFASRDELAISIGADVVFLSFDGGENPLVVWPTATVQWTLGLSERFAFFPELGLVGSIERTGGWQGISPNIGFGGRYFIWRSVSVVGRIGWPMALSLGATF